MKTSDRYLKIVRWSENRKCYVGTCPTLTHAIGDAMVRGQDEVEVYKDLCRAVDRWIRVIEDKDHGLPPPDIGDEYTQLVQRVFNLLLPYSESAKLLNDRDDQIVQEVIDQKSRDIKYNNDAIRNASKNIRDNAIDYSFIAELEGQRKLMGYVPNVNHSNSGVTIATGFDLGQQTAEYLIGIGLQNSLVRKLEPFVGLRGSKALDVLKVQRLIITEDEASEIDRNVKIVHTKSLIHIYDKDALVKFIQLPPEAQTVIASVSFQYGLSLEIRTPVFWRLVKIRDWHRTIQTLRDFKDNYSTRRNKEADLLVTWSRPKKL